MSLSSDTVARLMTALTSESAGNEVATVLNTSSSAASQRGLTIAAAITAAHTSSTTDFGALKVGDTVIHLQATPGNPDFSVVVTAGTLPSSAVVGDLYIVLRPWSAPASSSATL